ncbi:MAG: thrombospondin type 3 repeat-containing protein [Oceanipulchritudo sp.]
MKELLHKTAPGLFLSALVPAMATAAPLINPDFTYETPDTFVVQPDLDGDGRADVVLVDRAGGILRPGLYADGEINWLEAVPGGLAPVSGVAAGNFEDPLLDSLALVSGEGNRINVFAYTGDTLDRAPRPVYNRIWGLGEIAALEEGGSGTANTVELVGFSGLYDPGLPGVRDYLTWNGSEMESYEPGFANADFTERDYRTVLVETDLPMLGLFLEDVDPGLDAYVLLYLLEGGFDLAAEVPVPDGAEMVQASFDESGFFQFLFHVPGSDRFFCYAWTGGGLDAVGEFSLSAPAQGLFPYASGNLVGFFAVSTDGLTATFYAFNGNDPPLRGDDLIPSSGQPVSFVLPQADETIILLSGPEGGDTTAEAELFAWDGSFFSSIGSAPPPSLKGITTGGNVLLFSEPPFIVENAPLTGRLGSGVWTSGVVVGPGVVADVESYGGEQEGLGAPVPVNLGATPPGTSAALVNQVERDISLYDRRPAIGEVAGSVFITPDPGAYSQGVSPRLLPSDPDMVVLYRVLPDGEWFNGTGPMGPFFQDTAVQYFGILPDERRTQMYTANYLVTSPPGDLDSDGDGVPDYVEINAGLDPVNSGDDGDGDGFSDLIELLAGTDPTSALSTPPSREADSDGDGYSDLEEAIAGTNAGDPLDFPSGSVLDFQTVFDLVAVPYSHDGIVNTQVPSLDEADEVPGGDPLATNVRLYDPAASLIGFDRTALHGMGGVTDPSALFEEIAINNPELFQVVATERTFNIDIPATDRRLGRQTAALVPLPEAELPPVPYSYGSSGGSLSAEAAAWISAAYAHLLSQTRPQVVRKVDYLETLVLLLVELKVEDILTARGILNGDPLTLTGFRSSETPVSLSDAPGDGSRKVVVPASTLAELRHKAGPTDTGYILENILGVVDIAVKTDPDPRVPALRDVAQEIYRISAATANDAPGSLVPPLDALRQFIRSGSLLNTGYLSDPEVAPLDASTLANAYSAVGYILEHEMSRPVGTRTLIVTPGSFSGGCTLLEDAFSGETVSLVDFQGNPYALPDAFLLPVGTEIIVEGYTDVSSDCVADQTMEVIPQVQLVTLPVASSSDADGDLIPDEVEELYPIVLDTFGDSDGDGYSDLQEALEGTNPGNPGDVPPDPILDLSPPVIAIEESAPTTFTIRFTFPGSYADRFAFRLFSGPDLGNMATDTGLEAGHTGGDSFQLILNKPVEYPVFYRFRMQLR